MQNRAEELRIMRDAIIAQLEGRFGVEVAERGYDVLGEVADFILPMSASRRYEIQIRRTGDEP